MAQAGMRSELGREMSDAAFGDARLSERLCKVVETMQKAPDKSFPAMFDDTELEGAYRFFNNDEVTPERILRPHVTATLARMTFEPVTLVVHDTSTMSFDPEGVRQGLGRVRSKGQAFFAHVSLALRGDGSRLPLGVLALTTHIRDAKKKRKARAKDNANNERARWGKQVTSVSSLGVERARVVHLMDREADDFALLAQRVTEEDRFVIRLAQDRLLHPTTPDGARKLAEAVVQIRTCAERDVALSKRPVGHRSPKQLRIHPAREGRVAKLAMGATTVVLRRPASQPTTLPETVTLNVVRVWEVDAPQGETPVEWLLVTTEPVDTAEQILQVVDWYRARWVIEEFFKALKTGCAYRERQLADYEGLVNALAVFAPIACRLLGLRSLAQHDPDSPATRVLDPVELDVLRTFGKKPLPAAPTTRDVLLAVAALGGHIKWSGEPGWLTISRGFTELQTLTRGWCAARNIQSACDQR